MWEWNWDEHSMSPAWERAGETAKANIGRSLGRADRAHLRLSVLLQKAGCPFAGQPCTGVLSHCTCASIFTARYGKARDAWSGPSIKVHSSSCARPRGMFLYSVFTQGEFTFTMALLVLYCTVMILSLKKHKTIQRYPRNRWPLNASKPCVRGRTNIQTQTENSCICLLFYSSFSIFVHLPSPLLGRCKFKNPEKSTSLITLGMSELVHGHPWNSAGKGEVHLHGHHLTNSFQHFWFVRIHC